MSRKHAKHRGGPEAAGIAQPPTRTPLSSSAAAAPLDEVAASDEAAVAFFSAPPVTAPDEPVFHELPAEHATVVARRPIGDAVRRRELAKYVTGAVAVCFMICVAAAVRAATVHAETPISGPSGPAYHGRADDEPRAMATPAPAEPASAVEAPQPAPGRVENAQAPPAAEPPPAAPPPAAVETTHEAVPDPAAETNVEERPTDPNAAREAKRVAQRAIDRGNAAGAIEAGKRSLELDPTDAETWLIVGAAHLQRGAYKDARESFASCMREATRGPKNECRALLR